MNEELAREKKIECILRRALIYNQGMDENKDRENIVKSALCEAADILDVELCKCPKENGK